MNPNPSQKRKAAKPSVDHWIKCVGCNQLSLHSKMLCPTCNRNLLELRSLIAFVQKHKLDVIFDPTASGNWHVRDNRDTYLKVWKIASGKTWTAAVRKAKRAIEGRKR